MRQLLVVYEHVQQRCVAEGWTNWAGELLTAETVTLYDLNKHVIMPATEAHQCSYVELVTGAGEESARRCPDGHVPMARTIVYRVVRSMRWRRFRARSAQRSSSSAPPTGCATAAATSTSCAAHARRRWHP